MSEIKCDAMREAIRRYGPSGDVEGALLFYRGATDSLPPITEDDMKWAQERTG